MTKNCRSSNHSYMPEILQSPMKTKRPRRRRSSLTATPFLVGTSTNDLSNRCTSGVPAAVGSLPFSRRTRDLKLSWIVVVLALTHINPVVRSTAAVARKQNVQSSLNKEMSDRNTTRFPRSKRPLAQTQQEMEEDAMFLKWIRSLQEVGVTDAATLENSTLNPTLTVDPVSIVPSIAPTFTPSPTVVQSASPTGLASNLPTNLPTSSYSPSLSPTRTVMPSFSPSLSLQPSISSRPTTTYSPTTSFQPTGTPTTQLPSLSPTSSLAPSLEPSQPPSMEPSFSAPPSFSPTVSQAPSTSSMPSPFPSVVPTLLPSNIPSQPSEYPSMAPTIVLEGEPFGVDKISMVLDGLSRALEGEEIEIWQNVTSEHIVTFWNMLAVDHPDDDPLFVGSAVTQLLSQDIEMEQESVVGEDGTSIVLRIMYSQEFRYGIFDEVPNSEEPQVRQPTPPPPIDSETLQYYLVVMPFETDSYEYSNALMEALNLTTFVVVRGIETGDPPAPTSAPIGSGISQTAVRAISASIVVGACLVVAFLLWDRKRKDSGRFPADNESDDDDSQHGRRLGMDELEFDNAGQPVDWTNPYSEAAAAVAVVRGGTTGAGTTGGTIASGGGTTGGNRSGATSVSSREGSQSGEMPMGPLARATSIRSTPSSTNSPTLNTTVAPPPPVPMGRQNHPTSRRATSTGSLPPLAPGGTTLNHSGAFNGGSGPYSNGSGSGRSPFLIGSMSQVGGNWRHTSMTDTEITDLTYSDFQSDGRGSDVANLTHLPPISDESLKEEGPTEQSIFSPLHIPDEEAIDLAAGLTPSSSPVPSIMDLTSDLASPVMTGFNLQIQELE